MKKYLALVLYCLLFSILFATFYSYASEDASRYRYEVTRRDSDTELKDTDSKPLISVSRSRARGSPRKSSPQKDDGLVRYNMLAN